MTDFPSLPSDGDKRIVYVREVKTADFSGGTVTYSSGL